MAEKAEELEGGARGREEGGGGGGGGVTKTSPRGMISFPTPAFCGMSREPKERVCVSVNSRNTS